MSLNKFSRCTRLIILNALFLGLVACGGGGDESTNNITTAAYSDMSGDGTADIVIESQTSIDSMPWRIGVSNLARFDSSLTLTQTVEDSMYKGAKAIAVADADGDGKNDLLVQRVRVDGFTQWDVLISDGASSTRTIGNILLSSGNDARALAFTDIDSDGYADILFQQQIEGVVIYYMSLGDGSSFSNLTAIYNFDTQFGRPELIALEDINSDGTADLVYDLQLDGSHCFVARVFKDGAFEEQLSSADCLKVFNDTYLEYIGGSNNLIQDSIKMKVVGVADMTGDGQSELVFAIKQLNDAINNLSSRQSIEDLEYVSLVQGTNGSEWGSRRVSLMHKQPSGVYHASGEVLKTRTIALTDLNGDGHVDFLNEFTTNVDRQWQAYISKGDGTFETQTWLTGTFTDKALGLRDYNGDGRPDLLISNSGPSSSDPVYWAPLNLVSRSESLTNLYVGINTGSSFNTNNWLTWYTQPGASQVIGHEEDGLTAVAKDASTLISWSGISGSPRYTQNEFRALLTSKGLNLVEVNDSLEDVGDCQISYPSANTKDLSADFGNVVCKVEVTDGVTIKFQPIYGGCQVTKNDYQPVGYGGRCEIGTVKVELEIDLGGGVIQTMTVAGPKAAACSAISSNYLCMRAKADLIAISQTVVVNGTGVGAGTSVGVGLTSDVKIEDGVISGQIGGALGVGVSLKFSLNYEATGEFFVENGESAFIFVGANVAPSIVAAGSAVVDSGYIVGNVIETGAGESVSIIGEGAAGAGDFIVNGANVVGGVVTDIFDTFTGWF